MHEERGDIITSWLRQMLVIMAVLGFFGYEGLSMAVTAVTLDDAAEHVADEAADALSAGRSEEDVREAAETEAIDRGVEITDLLVDEVEDVVVVTVTRQANTLVAHRIPGVRDWTTPSATRRSAWRP